MNKLHKIAAVILFAAVATTQENPLTGIERTAHFDVRFRPGSPAEASVDRVAALVEGDLARILREVGLKKFDYRIELFLYDDVAELQRVTGARASGFSVPLASHVPHDNDQTRVHELVHVVAEKFTEHGSENRNLFFAEGLANAVLRFVHGVHVDTVAAFHKRRGDLPDMAEMHALDDFYGWLKKHPHVNSYDVAGSWMRFLLDQYGATRVRRYYKGTKVEKAFGKKLNVIERNWHRHLDKVKLRPGVLDLLNKRHGRTAKERNPSEFAISSELLGPEDQWRKVVPADLHEGDPAAFSADGKELVLDGRASQGDWCVARLGKPVGDALVRATIEPQGRCYGVKIQIGPKCQGMVLRGQGTFLYNEHGGAAHDGSVQLGARAVQIIVRRQKGRASVWIDGKLVVEADVTGEAAPIGIGCVGGKALARRIAVRKL